MQPRDRSVELDGLAFHYRDTGDPAAPPLVALQALGSDAYAALGLYPLSNGVERPRVKRFVRPPRPEEMPW